MTSAGRQHCRGRSALEKAAVGLPRLDHRREAPQLRAKGRRWSARRCRCCGGGLRSVGGGATVRTRGPVRGERPLSGDTRLEGQAARASSIAAAQAVCWLMAAARPRLGGVLEPARPGGARARRQSRRRRASRSPAVFGSARHWHPRSGAAP